MKKLLIAILIAFTLTIGIASVKAEDVEETPTEITEETETIEETEEIDLEAILSEIEGKLTALEEKRDEVENKTDWTQCVDNALSEEEKAKYKVYRQKLRDITEQENFPYNVVFPEV